MLADIELLRFGSQGALLEVLQWEGWPFATSLSAKSLLNERHPLCLGLYEGAAGPAAVRERVEGSDGLLILGMPLQDLDTGIFTMHLKADQVVRVEMAEGLRWSQGDLDSLDPVTLLQVWREAVAPSTRSHPLEPSPQAEIAPFEPEPGVVITVRRLVSAVNARINADTVVVVDPGDALFAAADFRLPAASDFLAMGGRGMPPNWRCQARASGRWPAEPGRVRPSTSVTRWMPAGLLSTTVTPMAQAARVPTASDRFRWAFLVW